MNNVMALCLSLVIATPAHAVCVFGFGTTCSIGNGTAAEILRPRVNGKLVGSFTVEHTSLLDTLRLGQSELKPGDNAHRLARAQAVRDYMNGGHDCRDVTSVWGTELAFSKGKEEFCERAQLMKARNLALVELSVTPIQPTDTGSRKQDVFLRLAMTQEGQARVERFLLSRDAESFTVATGTLNFLRIVRKDGGALAATVEFQYEVVPNAWTHVEKGLAKDTLPAERRVGKATFRKLSERWRMIHEPAL